MSDETKTYIVKDEIQEQINNMIADMQDIPADMPTKVSLGHEDYYLLCEQTFEPRVSHIEVVMYEKVLGLQIIRTNNTRQCTVE